MTFSDLHIEALTQTRKLLGEARAHYHLTEAPCEVRFDLRGAAAGQARHLGARGFLIRYNGLLLVGNGPAFLIRTPAHEVAHVIVWQAFGRSARPHGREWRAVMDFFGADPSRCHGFDLSALPWHQSHRYPYRCACQEHLLTSIRHNRILRGQVVYRCGRCGDILVQTTDDRP